jgi:2-(1,2-epoxy-1,2-dihydrophenyl)acetyl-CoA isomerase
MGPSRAKRFVLLAEVLKSQEALAAGLADRVVPDDRLQAEALELATSLAEGPTLAYAEIKRLFLRAGSDRFEAQLEDEAHTLARIATSADAQEGISAMVERRKPAFRGS